VEVVDRGAWRHELSRGWGRSGRGGGGTKPVQQPCAVDESDVQGHLLPRLTRRLVGGHVRWLPQWRRGQRHVMSGEKNKMR
jgi:hypothetical protein